MRLPRDLSADDLVRAVSRLGYRVDHQTGSHIRLTTERSGEHHLTIPSHDPLKIGTLSAILRDLSEHHGLTRDDLLTELFD